MRCVVNYAQGSWYPAGQQRLAETLKTHGGNPDLLAFATPPPGAGSPQSQTSKPAAYRVAELCGYSTILWCDASVFAIRDLGPVFEAVESQGVGVFGDSGWVAGEWASDHALAVLGVDRDDAMKWPWVAGCVSGVCLDHPKGRAWYRDWLRLWRAGAFGVDHPQGPHAPATDISTDPRVKGYRRDGVVLAYLQRKHRLDANLNQFCAYWSETVSPDIALVARGGVEWPWREWIESVTDAQPE